MSRSGFPYGGSTPEINDTKPTNMRRLSIGIVVYKNKEKEIHDCLSCILGQTLVSVIEDVVIRDHADGSSLVHVESWLASHSPPFRIKTIVGDNVGFSNGQNLAFSEISPDSTAYLCLNADGMMHPRCVERMYQKAEQVGWRGIFEAIQEPIMHPKRFDPATGATDWCSGACMLIPVELFKELDGFDRDFFLYMDDVDLCWRARALGNGCYTVSSAYFHHYAVDRASRAVEMWKSALLMAHKWRADAFKQHAVNVLRDFLDLGADTLLEYVEEYPQYPTEMVMRVAPNFKHNLYFAEPMWTEQ